MGKYMSDKYAKDYGFKDWEEFENNADYHIEKTERDMKVWYLEEISINDIIDMLDGVINTDYGEWDYIIDKDLWIYLYY